MFVWQIELSEYPQCAQRPRSAHAPQDAAWRIAVSHARAPVSELGDLPC